MELGNPKERKAPVKTGWSARGLLDGLFTLRILHALPFLGLKIRQLREHETASGTHRRRVETIMRFQ